LGRRRISIRIQHDERPESHVRQREESKKQEGGSENRQVIFGDEKLIYHPVEQFERVIDDVPAIEPLKPAQRDAVASQRQRSTGNPPSAPPAEALARHLLNCEQR